MVIQKPSLRIVLNKRRNRFQITDNSFQDEQTCLKNLRFPKE